MKSPSAQKLSIWIQIQICIQHQNVFLNQHLQFSESGYSAPHARYCPSHGKGDLWSPWKMCTPTPAGPVGLHDIAPHCVGWAEGDDSRYGACSSDWQLCGSEKGGVAAGGCEGSWLCLAIYDRHSLHKSSQPTPSSGCHWHNTAWTGPCVCVALWPLPPSRRVALWGLEGCYQAPNGTSVEGK